MSKSFNILLLVALSFFQNLNANIADFSIEKENARIIEFADAFAVFGGAATGMATETGKQYDLAVRRLEKRGGSYTIEKGLQKIDYKGKLDLARPPPKTTITPAIVVNKENLPEVQNSFIKKISENTGKKVGKAGVKLGKYDFTLVKKYFKHIQEVTGRAVPKNQIEKLKDALRVKEHTKLSTTDYAKHKKGYRLRHLTTNIFN